MVRRRENEHIREVADTLEQAPVFRDVSRGVLRDLAEMMHRRSYKRDEFIYYEHDPGMGFYIVQHGRVRLLAEDEQGQVHELHQVEEHEIFGEFSLLGNFRRMETAQAVTEVRVLGFFTPDLKTMLKRSPRAGAEVLEALAHFMAARQVELVRLVAAESGKVDAMRKLDSATDQIA